MIIAWMWQALIVGTLVAIAGLGFERLARLGRWPMRWGWIAALAVTIGLVALAPARSRQDGVPASARAPTVSLDTPREAMPGAPTPRWSSWGPVAAARSVLATIDGAVDRSFGWVARLTPHLAEWMILLWGASTITLLALLCAVEWRFRRARTGWPRADLHGIAVRVAPDVGPAVIGLRHPEIVVPRWLLDRDAVSQRLVLAHEREHVRAGDPVVLAVAWSAVILLPWHPAVWWMASRLRLAVEMDCDMRILHQGVVPRAYGTLLIDLAAHCSGLGAGAPAFSDRPTQLERRLSAMIPDTRTVSRWARARGGITAVLVLAALVAACEARMPSAADVQQMDASSAEHAARAIGALVRSDSGVVYTVNGTHVSAAVAHAIKADSVASIDVLRCHSDSVTVHYVPGTAPSAAAAGCTAGLIAITTRNAVNAIVTQDLADFTAMGSRDMEAAAGGTVASPSALWRPEPIRAQPVVVSDSAAASHAGPMYMLDGVKISERRARALVFDSNGNMTVPQGSTVESIEVIKGAAARQIYADPRAANGVILITTKH